jgi:hypothetical protein
MTGPVVFSYFLDIFDQPEMVSAMQFQTINEGFITELVEKI